MLRRILSSVVAVSIALAPMTTSASGDTFFFRYASDLGGGQSVPEVPAEQEQYGIGNDITAYYVAPVGFDFSKKIPVATQDVSDWRKDSGELPTGIFLDESTGLINGRPTAEGNQSLLYRGWDSSGNRIARAALNFTVFTPVGVGRELSFYGHTGTYFYQTIPLPDGVDVYRWEPIVGYPEGMSMKGLAFQGTPEKAGIYAIAWRGYNYVGREVAFAWGEFLVEDGPKIEYIENQTVARGAFQSFDVRPVVKHSLGTLVYTLVPEGGRPEGLVFKPETGHLYGIYPTYNTSARFHIDVTDSADGRTSSSNTFTLATLPQDIDLCCLNNLEATVNDFFSQRLTASVSDGEFQILQGQLPEGLQLGLQNGYIYGTPKKMETQEGIVIGVSGNGVLADQSQPFKFTVFPEAIVADIKPVHARTGESFATTAPAVRKGNVSPLAYSVAEGATIDDRLHLDAATGVISSEGISEAGNYDVTLSIKNGDGQTSKPVIQPISVHEPLSVSYASTTVKRLQPLKVDPSINRDAVVGTARYSIDGYTPSWMSFDWRTGRLSGTPVYASQERVWGPYTVTLSDDTRDARSSEPFTVTVAPRAEIEVSIVNDVAERFLANQKSTAEASNTYGNVRYSLSSGTLGGTLKITDSGVLVGATQDPVGTVYSGLVVTARDEDDIFGRSSDPFTITVVEPSDPKPLLGTFDFPFEWAADVPFSVELPELSNGFGEVTYSLETPSDGISIDSASRTLSGTISEPGVYAVAYTIKDDVAGRTPARGTVTITIKPPMTVSMEEVYRANVGSPVNIAPAISDAIGGVTYTLSGSIPAGTQYKDGRINRAPTAEGLSGVLTLTVRDEAGTSVSKSFRIDVGPALPFSVSYKPVAALKVGSSAGLPIQPTVTASLGVMSYALKPGLLPLGLDFRNGAFVGTPREAGTFRVAVVATDGGLAAADPADDRSIEVVVSLQIAPSKEMSFSQSEFTVRKGSPFSLDLAVADGVAPLSFEAASTDGIPHDLVLGPTGTLTGTLGEAATYDGIAVKVTDALGRSAEAVLAITAVDAMSASIPASLDFKQYSEGSVAVSVVNPAGTLSYAWANGSSQPPAGLSLDNSTGVISGSPEEAGQFSGFQLLVTDDFDGTTSTTETFTINVAERDPLVLTPPAPLMLKRFSTASARATVTSSVGAVTYDIAPDLPTGIDLARSTGEISGSSDETVPTTVYTMTATDEKAGEKGTAVGSFTLEVAERDPLTIVVAENIAFKQHAEANVGATANDSVGAVQWTISPALPEGLSFADGRITGVAHDVSPPAEYTITAVDSKGGELGSDEARVTISVEARAPLTPTVPSAYEFNQFFEGGFDATVANVLGAASWTFEPELPEWMIATVDEASGDLKIKGTPQDLMDPTQFVLTVEDDYDLAEPRTVSISVGERKPLKIQTSAADGQPIVLPGLIGYPFTTKLAASNARGSLTWTFVSGALPDGVVFDETKGAFSGIVSEYGAFPGIAISVADEKGGFDQRTFTLEIGQDGSPISISATNPPNIHLGQPVTVPAPVVNNAVGDVTFSTTGLAGTGLSIDPATGVISGTPKAAGTITAKVSATDITQRLPEMPATVVIAVLPAIEVESIPETEMVYNYDAERPRPSARNSVPANTWTLKSGKLPSGVTVDPATGAFVGKPKEVGTFGKIVIAVKDSLGGTADSAPITVKVEMNDDPIELAVADVTTHVGFEFSSTAPVYANELGTVSYFSPDAAAQGLAIDPATGVISGKIEEVRDVIINVSIRDTGTLRVTSRPLKLQVLPPVEIVLPAQVTLLALEQMTAVAPTVQYAVGDMMWDEVSDLSKLPPGVTFDKEAGQFTGMPTELGTFGPVTISGTDAIGGAGTSESIAFEVRPGSKFIGLADATLPHGERRTAYSYNFAQHSTVMGFEESDLEWRMAIVGSTGSLPAGLSRSGSVLSGTPTESGTYSIEVSLRPKDPASTIPAATKVYVLEVKLPTISMSFNGYQAPDTRSLDAYTLDFKDAVNVVGFAKSDLSWSLVSGALPPGTTVNWATGVLSGKPNVSGSYAFEVKAVFSSGGEEYLETTISFTVNVSGQSFRFSQVGNSSGQHFCGVTPEGAVKCWGLGTNGQLGDGGTSSSPIPVQVAGLDSGYQLAAVGWSSSCALSDQGSVKCWGTGSFGQLGNGLNENSLLPVDVDLKGDRAVAIASGRLHSCAALAQGGVKCWGYNNVGQLGTGTRTNANVPTAVSGLTDTVVSMAAGDSHTCAATVQRTVYCWGSNGNSLDPYGRLGQGGNGYTPAISATPLIVPGLEAVKLAAGSDHTCAQTASGGAVCWGRSNNGQTGTGSGVVTTSPRQVVGLTSGVVDISAGQLFSCAKLVDGSFKCWGSNNTGQLGIGSISGAQDKRDTPVTVTVAPSGTKSLSHGLQTTCAVTSGSEAWCWGDGYNGKLGNGSNINSLIAVRVGT